MDELLLKVPPHCHLEVILFEIYALPIYHVDNVTYKADIKQYLKNILHDFARRIGEKLGVSI